MPRMPKNRPKGTEPLVFRGIAGRGVGGPGPGGLRPSFQALTRGLDERQRDQILLDQGLITPGEVQRRINGRRR